MLIRCARRRKRRLLWRFRTAEAFSVRVLLVVDLNVGQWLATRGARDVAVCGVVRDRANVFDLVLLAGASVVAAIRRRFA